MGHSNDLDAISDNFDEWLVSMTFKIDELGRELPREIAEQMNYSPASLSILEKWLLSKYDSPSALTQNDKYFFDRLVCYVGETFRINLKGHWDIITDDRYFYFGLPVVRPYDKVSLCPMIELAAALGQRKGDYLEMILLHRLEEMKERQVS